MDFTDEQIKDMLEKYKIEREKRLKRYQIKKMDEKGSNTNFISDLHLALEYHDSTKKLEDISDAEIISG